MWSGWNQAHIYPVVAAFDRVPGEYDAVEPFGCGSPVGIVYLYAITFRWAGHALAVDTGQPLCGIGRKLILDGARLPQTLTDDHTLDILLRAAFDDS